MRVELRLKLGALLFGLFGFGSKPTEGLQSVYEFGVRMETARICIHSQLCKAGKIPKRVWNSPTKLVIEKPPANTMQGMVRCGSGMCTRY